MKLIRPSFEIRGNVCAIDILRNIELAGRVCYESEWKNPEGDFDKTKKFVKGIIARGHESVLEHDKLTVCFVVDRGVTHELVRHRIASFSQESTRYCDYGDGHVTFIIPPWVTINGQGVYGNDIYHLNDLEKVTLVETQADESRASYVWASHMIDSENRYKNLRILGWSPQQARSVLPNSLKTKIVVTANLREWRHIFKLRAEGTTGAPHPQMLEVMVPLLKKVQDMIPVIFDDITDFYTKKEIIEKSE